MSQLLVQNYLNEIDRLRKFSGLTNEQVIRPAFRKLLDSWAGSQKLIFLEELPYQTSQKTTVYPDGTILHDIRVPLGFWEAKDTADKLEEEIEKKFRRGYPQDNIIFENSERAILYQNRQPAMECAMTDVSALLRLLNLFFSYERQEIAEFRKAVQQFSADLPAVLDALRGKIDAAYRDNAGFRQAAEKFLRHAKDTINPSVGEADVREMLIQHILTEEIFTHVFNEGDFHRENNIARELYALEGKFFTGAVKRETLKALEPYYAAIRANAAAINSHSEKQAFLKVIYENFYKVYNPKAADRLGVVYTPNEIVKFMIEGADWLTQKHFGKALIDSGVEILDPATGTGTFITELLQHFAYDQRKLAQKYKNELHANEVAILPYYVANLNIEATYFGITGQYAEFENLCFVDTLDNVAGLGIRAGYQHDMFAGLSDENIERVKRQNKRKISVIIGNPPYNANQQNENDNNKNREYKRIDGLIKSSYIRPEYDTKEDKLSFLAGNKASDISWDRIEPDKNANWINLTDNDWEDLIPVADKKTKAAQGKAQEKAIFKLFSLGVVTNRDEWTYDFNPDVLRSKITLFAARFNEEIERWRQAGRPSNTSDLVSRDIKWTSELEAELRREKPIRVRPENVLQSAYRPFVTKWTYFAKPITHRTYQNFDLFPDASANNVTIATVVEPRAEFAALATNILVNKDFFMPSAAQHFARYATPLPASASTTSPTGR